MTMYFDLVKALLNKNEQGLVLIAVKEQGPVAQMISRIGKLAVLLGVISFLWGCVHALMQP
ncbi:hypothetical protein LDJ79_22195 [Vibrio tritonius]|uniref:Uncharacterized protein n=1 Tax=Vibrio tritonius TaxID=1435069 RepID=A0ABS7YT18_9VIBR|nr:hypothetical protein [Vibrio tritonius]MCA2018840.1 hypothetical protein [Vibrio tritonius]